MFQPFRLRSLELANRVIVSAMDMYSAHDGVPSDFHLVHLGGKALGGAGLVMTEMVCVSAAGRITPGCAGLYTAEQEEAWARITSFVHESSGAAIGIQLGHSGRKGATRLMWDGMDEPLATGAWEVCGPSPLPYAPGLSQIPRELSAAGMRRSPGSSWPRRRRLRGPGSICLSCTARTATCCRPSSRRYRTSARTRTADRWRPGCAIRLRCSTAMRAEWPADKPMTVRISASDWDPGGMTGPDAVQIAARSRRPARTRSSVDRAGHAGREAGLRPLVSDPVRGSRSGTRSASRLSRSG